VASSALCVATRCTECASVLERKSHRKAASPQNSETERVGHRLARRFRSLYVLIPPRTNRFFETRGMAGQIVITEKSSQAKDVRAAVGSRYGEILPAEGHLLDLLVARVTRTEGTVSSA
jgi:hypothetical protein